MNTLKTRLKLFYLAVIVMLISCSALKEKINYTKNWQGSDLPGHIYASFDSFNGKQDFNVQKFSGTHILIKYSTQLKEGSLRLEIICAHKTILDRDISAGVQDSVSFDNPDHNPVKFIFRAKQAVGKFDLTY